MLFVERGVDAGAAPAAPPGAAPCALRGTNAKRDRAGKTLISELSIRSIECVKRSTPLRP